MKRRAGAAIFTGVIVALTACRDEPQPAPPVARQRVEILLYPASLTFAEKEFESMESLLKDPGFRRDLAAGDVYASIGDKRMGAVEGWSMLCAACRKAGARLFLHLPRGDVDSYKFQEVSLGDSPAGRQAGH